MESVDNNTDKESYICNRSSEALDCPCSPLFILYRPSLWERRHILNIVFQIWLIESLREELSKIQILPDILCQWK